MVARIDGNFNHSFQRRTGPQWASGIKEEPAVLNVGQVSYHGASILANTRIDCLWGTLTIIFTQFHEISISGLLVQYQDSKPSI